MSKAYLILSGKGGVGKSTVASALADLWAQKGLKTVLVDGDVGLRCAEMFFGMQHSIVWDAQDVLDKSCTLSQALCRCPDREMLYLLAAPQALSPSDIDKKDMGSLIDGLKAEFDRVILDCPAGLGRGVKNLWNSADEAIVVATPDALCLRDAERVGQMLFDKKKLHPYLLLNRYDRTLLWDRLIESPERIAGALDMPLLGVLPQSDFVYRALLQHKPASRCAGLLVRKNLRNIAEKLLD